MPHFSKDLLDSRPDALAALREVLHGRQKGGRTGEPHPATPPSAEERFGVAAGGRAAPVRKRRPSALART